MKKLSLIFLFMSLMSSIFATPAKPGVWKMIELADGSQVKAELRGDEFVSYWVAENGKAYVRNANAQYFIEADMQHLESMAGEARMKNPLPVVAGEEVGTRVGIGESHPVFVGEKKGLIILAEFTDMKFQPGHDAEYYSHIANDLNFSHEDGFVGSIRDYFLAQSYGQFDLTFDVVGPIQLTHDMAYYGAPSQYFNDVNPWAMIREAAYEASKILPSFEDYDWFGDGYVDQVFVIYAGRGEADGGDENTIWPHRSEIGRLKLGGKYINVYACSNEMQSDTKIDGIGAFCHEFSHCLGLPDLYDTGYTGNSGMGYWDIMSAGNYLGESFRPCAYSGYERNYCGWKEPVILESDTIITNVKGITEDGDYFIIYNDAHKDEYYILENRNQTGWDANQFASGLLVTHIDFKKSLWQQNLVNTTDGVHNNHQRYAPIPADNRSALTTYEDIIGDLYPYKANNSLTNITTPASILYNKNIVGGKFMNKPVIEITRNPDKTVSFVFINENYEKTLPEGYHFIETFDNCAGKGGNDGIWKVGSSETATIHADNSDWEYSECNGGNKCIIVGADLKKGKATTPEITIEKDALLTFKTAVYSSGGKNITIALSNPDVTASETTVTMVPGEWNEYSVKLTAPAYPAKVAISFSVNKGRFFLDEVNVLDLDENDIRPVFESPETRETSIYTIDGRYVGNSLTNLSSGVYVINGRKIIK